MNLNLLIAYAHMIGGLWLVIYAGRKRFAVGQWLGLAALLLGTALLATVTLRPPVAAPHVALTPGTIVVAPLTPPTPTATLMPTPADIDPQALLVKADAAMNQLRSLAEVQYLYSEVGRGVTVTLEYLAPDKLRFKVGNGDESVAIGDTQYYVEPGKPWEKRQRPFPFRWPDFDYARSASAVKVEGLTTLDGEVSAVVTFKAPKVELYRHWIGLTTGWLRKQQMIAPGHNMLSTFSQFNAPLEIAAPLNQ